MDRCFFLSTGSETIEAASRIIKRKSGKFEILGFDGSFHGRTYAAASIGGMTGSKRGYGPCMPGVIRASFPYYYRCPFGSKSEEECADRHIECLDNVVRAQSTGSLAGLVVEPYQGAAGFNFPAQWILAPTRGVGPRTRIVVRDRRGAIELRPHRMHVGSPARRNQTRPDVYRQRHRKRLPRLGHRRPLRCLQLFGAGRE